MPPRHLDRYEMLEELGRGSMGVVYKAQDPVIDRTVAIKTISLDEPGSETDAWRQRFYREAKSAGRLNHPNIVIIYDVGESENVAYIAMEFLAGQSLREILDSGTVLPPTNIADIAAQVADGLAFAHQNGVVHRDIKPANIMVADSGVVKITDFGIARLPSGTRTVAGTVFGSPKYISPERLQGFEVDGRSDVFSLGAVLYEMLTGFPPFFGGDLGAIMHQVLHVMPAPPSTRNRSLPRGFDYIVAKALAKRPEDRYRDAREMASDLRNFRDLKPPAVVEQAIGAPDLVLEQLPWREGDPTLRLDVAVVEAKPGALAALRAKVVSLTGNPRFPTLAVSGLAAVLLAAVVGWMLLPGRATNTESPPVRAAIPIPIPAPAAIAAPANPPPANVATSVAPPPAEVPVVVAHKPPVPDKPLHRVALAVTPWGEIYVNGKKLGVSPPMTELKLAPGKYTVEIRNTTFEPHRESIDVSDGSSVKIRHRFQ